MFSAALQAVAPKYGSAESLMDALLDLYDEYEGCEMPTSMPAARARIPRQAEPEPDAVHPIQLRVCMFVLSWTGDKRSFDADFANKPKMILALHLLHTAATTKPTLAEFCSQLTSNFPFLKSLSAATTAAINVSSHSLSDSVSEPVSDSHSAPLFEFQSAASSPSASISATSSTYSPSFNLAKRSSLPSLPSSDHTARFTTVAQRQTSITDLIRKPKSKTWCELFLEIDSTAIALQLTYLDSQPRFSAERQLFETQLGFEE
ncbi:hypothetical protein HK100_001491 [Physocladia obscura]|uniref:Uncharacterized protein n=1 Tax=Physocladia obscura TaxID=109957 RepID=A0AAD5SWZ3_9FUNG|nr:hypothetical protein HK100_001491 [Physocladia obscura]